MGKNPPAMRDTWLLSLGWKDPLEEGIVTHSSILAWRIPMDRGAWQATVHGVAELDTTEWLSSSRGSKLSSLDLYFVISVCSLGPSSEVFLFSFFFLLDILLFHSRIITLFFLIIFFFSAVISRLGYLMLVFVGCLTF